MEKGVIKIQKNSFWNFCVNRNITKRIIFIHHLVIREREVGASEFC